MWYVIIGLICFCAGFFAAALLASRSRDELLEEMDRSFKAAWKG
jgi:site-specific recombinase